jgi:hypothetical protein
VKTVPPRSGYPMFGEDVQLLWMEYLAEFRRTLYTVAFQPQGVLFGTALQLFLVDRLVALVEERAATEGDDSDEWRERGTP